MRALAIGGAEVERARLRIGGALGADVGFSIKAKLRADIEEAGQSRSAVVVAVAIALAVRALAVAGGTEVKCTQARIGGAFGTNIGRGVKAEVDTAVEEAGEASLAVGIDVAIAFALRARAGRGAERATAVEGCWRALGADIGIAVEAEFLADVEEAAELAAAVFAAITVALARLARAFRRAEIDAAVGLGGAQRSADIGVGIVAEFRADIAYTSEARSAFSVGVAIAAALIAGAKF